MKHALKITLLLIFFYVVAQAAGLYLLNQDMEVQVVDGKPTTTYSDTSLGPRPEMTGAGTFLYLVVGVGIGTALLLLIVKFGKRNLWKAWFLLATFLAMTLALGAVMPAIIAAAIAFVLAILKVYRSNVYIHNLTEILMYSGIAIFFVPIFDLKWAIILMVVFSAYDAYAVWKSKHMVKMAEFQADSNLFAGLSLSYDSDEEVKVKPPEDVKGEKKMKTAILGGGDIAIPLLFTGAVMQWLVQTGVSQAMALYQSFIVTIFSAVALAGLFFLAEKEKYYPAMPFLTIGCFLGLGIVALI